MACMGIAGTEEGNRGPIHVVFGNPLDVAPQEIDLNNPRSYMAASRPILDELYVALSNCQTEAISLQRG